MSDFFKYICLFLGIPLQESKEDRIKHFVQYSQVLSHSKRTTNSLRKSIVDLPIETSTKHNTKISDNECGIRSVAEDNHAYSEGRLCCFAIAWSPEEYDDCRKIRNEVENFSGIERTMTQESGALWSYETLVDFCKTYTKPSKTCRPWIISIDGNIGAGKTTLLQKIQRDVDPKRVVVVYEPVQKWTEMKDMNDGMSLLQKYYTYPHMYSFMFQTVIFQTIIQSIEEAIENHPDCDIIVCERSIKSSRNVFCKMLVEDQYMTSFEHAVYESFFTPRIYELYYPDHTIWLDVPVKICLERIISRAREGENIINVDYLQRIESLYLQERTF